jgi:hypothetical protein
MWVIERLRVTLTQKQPTIEVFDFDSKWNLVLPILHDDRVERVLADLLNRCLHLDGSEYAHKQGPWSYAANE